MEGSNSCDMSPDASRPYAIDSQTAGLGRGPRSAGRRACRAAYLDGSLRSGKVANAFPDEND